MKKFFLALGALVIVFAMAACKDDKEAGDGKASSFAVVKIVDVFQKAESAKAAQVYMTNLSNEMAADVKGIQESIDKAPDSKKEELRDKLQTTLTNYQQKLRAEEEQVRLNFINDYQKTIDDYRKAHGISIVLHSDAIVSADEKIDITKEIIAEMDSNFKKKGKEAATSSEVNATGKASSTSEGSTANEASPTSEGNSTKSTNATQ